jgi:hypothetical protein
MEVFLHIPSVTPGTEPTRDIGCGESENRCDRWLSKPPFGPTTARLPSVRIAFGVQNAIERIVRTPVFNCSLGFSYHFKSERQSR